MWFTWKIVVTFFKNLLKGLEIGNKEYILSSFSDLLGKSLYRGLRPSSGTVGPIRDQDWPDLRLVATGLTRGLLTVRVRAGERQSRGGAPGRDGWSPEGSGGPTRRLGGAGSRAVPGEPEVGDGPCRFPAGPAKKGSTRPRRARRDRTGYPGLLPRVGSWWQARRRGPGRTTAQGWSGPTVQDEPFGQNTEESAGIVWLFPLRHLEYGADPGRRLRIPCPWRVSGPKALPASKGETGARPLGLGPCTRTHRTVGTGGGGDMVPLADLPRRRRERDARVDGDPWPLNEVKIHSEVTVLNHTCGLPQ